MAILRHASCPACDRYVGMVRVCPFCDTAQPPGARILRSLALLLTLAACGLAVLSARQIPPTPIHVAAITRSMHGAYVSVSGEVNGTPAIERGMGGRQRLVFRMNDAGDLIQVVCPDAAGQWLIDKHRVPRKHEHIVVSGTLSVGLDGLDRELRCRDAASLCVLPELELHHD